MSDEQVSAESAWAFHRHDLGSLGYSTGGFNGKLDIVWERSTGARPAGPLTLCNGFLVYPGSKRKIYLFETADGRYRGYVRSKSHAQAGMIISDSLGVFVEGPRRNRIRCINLLNKDIVWEHRVVDVTPGLLLTDTLVVLSTADGAVSAYGMQSGELVWSYKTTERLAAPPSLRDSLLIQPGDKGTIFAINVHKGTELYRTELGSPVIGAAAVSNSVYLADLEGTVHALSKDNGEILWQKHLNVPIWASPAVAYGRVYIASKSGQLSALDAATGEVEWQFSPGTVFKSAPIVAGEYLLAGTMSGILYCLSASDGALVSQREFSGAIGVSPVTDGESVYVATDRGELVCLGDAGTFVTKE